MKKILLVDGNALMYKSFYASSFLLEKGQGLDDRGNPINALRTFSTMILNLIEMNSECKMLVAFDHKNVNTYRNKHDFYKSGRKKTPDELIYQKPLIIELLDHAGIHHFSSKDYEADDIIGILSKKFSLENDSEIEIITSDKDLLQLVTERVSVYISKTGVSDMLKYTNDNFSEHYYGLKPMQVIDMKGIMGDSSDNLPGIKGIGEKGAVNLLKKYGTLENIIAIHEELSPSISKKISEEKDMAILCKKIATIITEGNLKIDLKDLDIGPIDKKRLLNFLKYNSIWSLANRLEKKWL